MKILLSVILFLASLEHCAAQQTTALDTTFGVNGIVLVDSPAMMQNNKIALQQDGKIVLAGTYYYYLLPSFDMVYEQRIMRFMPDGSLDYTFNDSGIVSKLTDRSTRLAALNIQADGKILVSGSTGYIERYLPNGKIDSSFNDSGRVVLNYFGPYDYIGGTAVQADGKIVMTGFVAQQYILLTRFDSTGHIDNTFGFNGLVTTALDSSDGDNGSAVVIQPDGKILVAGQTRNNITGSRFSVLRYDTSGYFDPAFNNGKGYTKIAFPELKYAGATILRLLPDGRIIVGGVGYDASVATPFYRSLVGMARLTTDGLLDNSFNSTGRVVADSLGNESAFSDQPRLAVQADGKILIASTDISQRLDRQFAIRRFNVDGTPDNTFGYSSRLTTNISPNRDITHDMLVQPDGKILVCGVGEVDTNWPQPTHSLPVIVRYRPDAKLNVPPSSGNLQGIRLYPNPATNSVTVQYNLDLKNAVSITMHDLQGRIVQQWPARRSASGTNTVFLSLKDVMPGIYLLMLESNGERRMLKLEKSQEE